jgi:hypothetical protein
MYLWFEQTYYLEGADSRVVFIARIRLFNQPSQTPSLSRAFLFNRCAHEPMYRSTVYLPIKLINQANNENWLRSLAYLVRLKAAYKNPTFFKFSLRKVAASIKCSPACLAFHLKVLEQHGLVRFHSSNLTVTGYRALERMFRTKRFTGVTVDIKNQYDILRSLIIKFNLQRQEYRMRKNERKICTHRPD